MMTTLYDLVGERLALQNKLEALNLDEETINDTLEGDSKAINAKVESYAFVIKNMRAPIDAINAEIKRLQDKSKQIEANAKRAEDWLFTQMQIAGISKIECPIFTIALQNNPPSVVIDDESAIPSDYMKTPAAPPPSPDKTLIGKAIKDGFEVAGCRLETKQRLVIK